MVPGAGPPRLLQGSAQRGLSPAPPPPRPLQAGKLRLGRGARGTRRGGAEAQPMANARPLAYRELSSEVALRATEALWVEVQFP